MSLYDDEAMENSPVSENPYEIAFGETSAGYSFSNISVGTYYLLGEMLIGSPGIRGGEPGDKGGAYATGKFPTTRAGGWGITDPADMATPDAIIVTNSNVSNNLFTLEATYQ